MFSFPCQRRKEQSCRECIEPFTENLLGFKFFFYHFYLSLIDRLVFLEIPCENLLKKLCLSYVSIDCQRLSRSEIAAKMRLLIWLWQEQFRKLPNLVPICLTETDMLLLLFVCFSMLELFLNVFLYNLICPALTW